MADAQELARLLSSTAQGDQRAFADLYTATSSHLYALLLRILKRRDWAEEALQDCFIRVWQKSDSYSSEKGAPLTWLLSIARYRALDLLRSRRPEDSQEDEDVHENLSFADTRVDLAGDADHAQSMTALRRCMATLQDEQRKSVLLAYYEGYTHHELSRRLEAPLGTVKSWVRRGLQRLRECLES